MAYDETLAALLREELAGEPGLTEQRMFGGLAFLLGGHLAVAASGQGGLMVRCDPDETDELLNEPHAVPFQMRGRPMRGWLRVGDGGLDDESLARWVSVGRDHARSLPPKAAQ